MIIWIAMATCFMASCDKNDTIPTPAQEQQGPVHPKSTRPSALRGGGEDDENPIVMHKVKNQANAPVPQARVVMVNGAQTDTLEMDTDSVGECRFVLPVPGPWLTVVSRPGYHPMYIVENFVDSVNIRTRILTQP